MVINRNRTVHLIWQMTAMTQRVVAVCTTEQIRDANLALLRIQYPRDRFDTEEMPLFGEYE